MSIFSKVAIETPKKSVFDLSHTSRLTCEAGKIVPIFCQYTMPGDKWQISCGCFGRTLAMLAPMMQDVSIDVHFFSVPLRLLWKNFETFISGPEKMKTDSEGNKYWPSDPVHPYFTLKSVGYDCGSPTMESEDGYSYLWCTSSLADYLGYPVPKRFDETYQSNIDGVCFTDDTTKFDPFPFRAYQLIYNEWYRDENLIDELDIETEDDGFLDTSQLNMVLLPLRSRAWKKDYFTSALPWPQRGEDVMLSFTGSVDVDASSVNLYNDAGSNEDRQFIGRGNTTGLIGRGYALGTITSSSASDGGSISGDTVDVDFDQESVNPNNAANTFSIDGITASLTNMSNSTIIELRRAFALQKWFENSARLGGRYIEQMLAHFGVQSSDARLQRPEFIGGFSTPLSVSEVVQTSESSDDNPLGTLGGKGVAVGSSSIGSYYCEEHCIIMGLLTVRPKSLYELGIPRQFNMFERFDFPFPEFANIGEQAILKQELTYSNYESSTISYNSNLVDTFGYTPRYAEFKYIPSTVHGEFKNTLDYWTMYRKYDIDDVELNEAFIDITEASESNKRPFAYQVEGNDDYIIQVNFDIKAVRPLPYFSTPGYLDN